MVDDIEISDESADGVGEVLSIKEIILRQVRKIADISCKEFTGGYWKKKPVKTGNGVTFVEVYQEDVREAYCNAVDFLIDIVYPLSDTDLMTYLKNFEGCKDKIVKYERKDKKEKELTNEVSPDIEIKQKIKLKRQSFRQINIMFERNNFWKGTGSYNE